MVQQKKEKPECYKIDLVETLVEGQLEASKPGIDQVLLQSLENKEVGLDEETNLSVRWLSNEVY
ncbi:hypothetical protein A2U01_0083501, partial [Trifolium medium]|nr:hypothetical protein [Trifolium medium]